ncbi:MAG: GNAT family N-acetyltransferase [Pseudomonadota bacterium]|nr:GNAT family N-acetyltransferase [Pseudomonadota bacterium]
MLTHLESLARPVGAMPWQTAAGSNSLAPLQVSWAQSEAEVHAAQQLRYLVFVEEMGARPAQRGAADRNAREADRFDSYCDHLLVRAAPCDEAPDGLVVGTYRVLRPAQALRAGGFYCDSEFDLTPLASLRDSALELGRSCVHPAWRSGAVVMTMWRALGEFMLRHRLDTMIGCASIWLGDNGHSATQVWEQLRHRFMAPPHLRVLPREPMPLDAYPVVAGAPAVEVPALIKAYLRCGARVLGPPARDAAFNTADLPLMMRFDDIAPRYRKHFLGQ